MHGAARSLIRVHRVRGPANMRILGEGGRMPGIMGGLIQKLSDKVTLTRAFAAREKNRPFMFFSSSHRVSPIPFIFF